MAISIENYTTATVTSDEITIAKPAGVLDDDLLVAHICNNASRTVTPPAGWTQGESVSDGSPLKTYLFYKVIANAGGEPANYIFTLPGGAADIVGAIICLRGGSTSDPWETNADDDGNSDTPTTPTVTAAVNASMLLCFVNLYDGEVAFAPPGGMAELYDFNDGNDIAQTMAYLQVNAGPTSSKVFDADNDDEWLACAVILNPPSVGIARPLVGGSLASGILTGKGLAR